MLKNLKKKKNNKGFTLVELLVVIAIIGVLAVVAVPTLFKQIDKSRAAKVEANYSAIKTATIAYYTDNGTLTGISDLDDLDLDKGNIDEANYTITVSGDADATLTVSGLSTNVKSILDTSLANSLAQATKTLSGGAEADSSIVLVLMSSGASATK